MDYAGLIRVNLRALGFDESRTERMAASLTKIAKFLSKDGAVSLSPDVFDFALKAENTARMLGVEKSVIVKAAVYDATILIRNPDTVLKNAREISTLLGVPLQKYAEAVLPHSPHLLGRPAPYLYKNFKGAADALKIDETDYLKMCLKQPTILRLGPESLLQTVTNAAAKISLTPAQYISAAMKEPSLLYKKPETTAQNVLESAALLGLSVKSYASLLRKHGQEQLLAHDPKTFARNIDETTSLLGVERAVYIKAVKDRPTILAYNPETLKGKVEDMARLLGVTFPEAVRACMKAPPLITLDMEEISKNVDTLAAFLQTDRAALAQKLVRQGPQALYQNPNSIHERLQETSRLTGISPAEYMGLALKKVNLLWRAPEAIAHNLELMTLFNKKGILERDIKEFYTGSPDILAVSPTNFHLRYLYAVAADRSGEKSFSLLKTSRKEIEEKYMEILGYDPKEKTISRRAFYGDDQPVREKKHTAMVGLIKRGILSTFTYDPAP